MGGAAVTATAQVSVYKKIVKLVYQMDLSDTEFLFSIAESNSCGGKWYNVKSPSEVIASRKFAIVLSAYSTGSKIAFCDHGVCGGDRATLGWVRFD